MNAPILVGVDGGGTQTRAVVCGRDGAVWGRGQSGSSNLYNLGLERATHHIFEAINGALLQAKIERNQVESFGFGLAGIVGESEKTRWRGALEPVLGARVWLEEDAIAALVGAFGPDELRAQGGAILIAGTGANCLGQSAKGEIARADGWGPILGDRGSGFWLGEAAIRAAVAAFDGASPATSLQKAMFHHFGVADLGALVGQIYAPAFERQRIAAFAAQVGWCAAQGDEVALSLLHQSANLLAATARGVLNRLEISRLVILGGLLEKSEPVRARLQWELETEIRLQNPRFEAAVGAAFLPFWKNHDR